MPSLNFHRQLIVVSSASHTSPEKISMTRVDHARLVQALQDTSTLVARNIDPQKHSLAAKKLQNSIAQLLGELNKDWLEVMTQQSAKPSVGIPD
jgi:hypothetical protein